MRAEIFAHLLEHPLVQGSPSRGLDELRKDAAELLMEHRALALDLVEGLAGNFHRPLRRTAAGVKAERATAP